MQLTSRPGSGVDMAVGRRGRYLSWRQVLAGASAEVPKLKREDVQRPKTYERCVNLPAAVVKAVVLAAEEA